MSMYGVPASQCEPIRNRRLSPLPRNRFLEPEAVIAEGIKGKTLPHNTFSIPSRTIGGRIRKVSQYSVRSDDDDDDEEDGSPYQSAAEEDDNGDEEVRRYARRKTTSSRFKEDHRRPTSIARSRSENDVSRDENVGLDRRKFNNSPFLTVPDQGGRGDSEVRRRSCSTKSTKIGGSSEDLRTHKKRKSPKTRRRSVPANAHRKPTLTRRTTPTFVTQRSTTPTLEVTSAGGGHDGFLGLSGTAMAGAGTMAMGVGVGEGLGGVVMDERSIAHDDDDDAHSSRSPSPPIIEINLTEHDGNFRRINDEDDGEEYSSEELENSTSPPPPLSSPPPPPPFSTHQVEEMRRVLKFFFMDPIQKWKARRRFPWKLCLQLLKIIFITIQLCLFGSQRSAFIIFSESNKVAFEHLYLKDWDPALEGMPYPPPRGPYAIYDKDSFFEIIDYAINNYFNTCSLAVGVYAVHSSHPEKSAHTKPFELVPSDVDNDIPPPEFCQSYFPDASIFPENNSYSFPHRAREECFTIATNDGNVSIREELNKANMTIEFDALINITLRLKVKTVHLRRLVALDYVTCYIFDVDILFDNHEHSGQIPVRLKIVDHWQKNCSGLTAKSYHEDEIVKCVLIFFDCACVCISVLSLVLCGRSLLRATRLCDITDNFLETYKGRPLTSSERWEFVNFWYLMIILNDILAIIGSVFKILMETKIIIDWNMTGLALGSSNLLVWVGVLRYLSFFSRYNILIITLKHAMPDLIRFLVCTLVLFFGFVFCGWAVLGPYNLKFRSIWTTMMCLFSLVNGDDMFVTFTASSPESNLVWYFSQLYLYAFVSLFIYVNISLFTAVILDSYSLIKYYYQHGFPKSELFEFIDECEDPPEGDYFKKRSQSSLHVEHRGRSNSRVSHRHSHGSHHHSHGSNHHSHGSDNPSSTKWQRLQVKSSNAFVDCFRCCGRRRQPKRQHVIGGYTSFNNAGINRSNSQAQQLVYTSESEEDSRHPGNSLHI